MMFTSVFQTIGQTLTNKDTFIALKNAYMTLLGYPPRKATYAALGCMSGRSQGSTCIWFKKNNKVFFERTA